MSADPERAPQRTVDPATDGGGTTPHRSDTDDGTLDHVPVGEPDDRTTDVGDVPGYRVGGEIARGGMGVVLAAEDLTFGRRVAVKTLLRGGPGAAAARRFVTEARITGRLQHPGIPPVHALGELPDGRPYLAMKLIQGRTLAALLKERSDPGQELPRFVQVFEQMCQAVGYAHGRGVIHRDLKPLNVMVGEFGEVQVMDWGLAKDVKAADESAATAAGPDAAEVTQAGAVMGTPAFMAPEQARGEVDRLGPPADVFALGAVLCQMLTGKPPYVGATSAEVVRAAAHADLGYARAALDFCGADAELVAVATRCLDADPAARPADAGAVAALVAEYRTGVDERLRDAQSAAAAAKAKAAEQRKRRRVQFALTVAVMLLVAAGVAFAWWENWQAARKHEADQQQRYERSLLTIQRNSRLEAVADDIDRRLDESAAQLRAGDAPAAARPLSDADARLNEYQGELPPARLSRSRARAAQLQSDLETVRALDRVDELRWAVVDGKVFHSGDRDVIREWEAAFKRYGLNPDQVGRGSFALQRALASPAKDRLVAALDLWLASEPAAKLLPLLAALDPDPYRDAVRAAVHTAGQSKQWKPVIALLAKPDASRQPPRFGVALAQLAGLTGDTRARILQALHREYPSNFAVLMTLPRSLPAGTPAMAWERAGWYRAALSARPTSPAAWNDLGVALADAGDLDGAVAAYQQAIRCDDRLAHAYANLGSAYHRLKREPEALAATRRALALDPNHAGANLNLSTSLLASGDAPGAVAAARTAVAAEPRSAKALNNLAMALQAAKDLPGAAATYRRAIGISPHLFNPHYNLGNLYDAQGDYVKAVACFREAVRCKPDFAEGHTNLGNALAELGRREEAVGCYRRALDINPDLREAPLGLCDTLYELGEFPASVAAGRDAVRLNPKSAPAHLAFARSLFQVGEFDDAAEHLRTARGLEPNAPGVLDFVAKVQADIHGARQAEAKLPAVVAGTARPATPDEAIELADVCGKYRRRFALAVALARVGFADPKLTSRDLAEALLRFEASGYAVQAAAGRGVDPPADADRPALRRQALDWLAADLAVWKQDLAEGGRPATRAAARAILTRWVSDRNLSPVREPEQIAALPRDERQAWHDFWAAVRTTRDLATERAVAPAPRPAKPQTPGK